MTEQSINRLILALQTSNTENDDACICSATDLKELLGERDTIKEFLNHMKYQIDGQLVNRCETKVMSQIIDFLEDIINGD